MSRKLQVGDIIKVVGDRRDAELYRKQSGQEYGIIVGFDEGDIAVESPVFDESLHDCEGITPDGRGWWLVECDLEVVV